MRCEAEDGTRPDHADVCQEEIDARKDLVGKSKSHCFQLLSSLNFAFIILAILECSLFSHAPRL